MSNRTMPTAPPGRVSPATRKPHARGSGGLAAWWYALPAFIAIFAGFVYPLLYALWLSFHRDRLSANDGQFVGFSNYTAVFQRGELLGTLGKTLTFTFGSVVACLVIGFAAAVALESFPRASRIIRPVLLLPWVIPGVAIATVWFTILNPITGLANRLLDLVGIAPVGWLSSGSLAMTSLVVVNTWKGFPFVMLMISAGLTTVPKEVIEAAKIDGASAARTLRSITIPLMAPVLSITTVLSFIWAFNYFDLAYLLTAGGPNGATTTLPFAIWQASIRFNRFDEGAVYSVLSVVVVSIAVVFYLRMTRKKAEP